MNAPFDPSDDFDVGAERFRKGVVDLFLEAKEEHRFARLSSAEQIICFMVGALTGVVGATFVCVDVEGRDEAFKAIADCLPQARRQAESILDPEYLN